MCPNCGSCFSKKSNLYNHLHRGKGCPKRNEKDSSGGSGVETPSKQEEKREKATKRGKIRYAVVKQEEYAKSVALIACPSGYTNETTLCESDLKQCRSTIGKLN